MLGYRQSTVCVRAQGHEWEDFIFLVRLELNSLCDLFVGLLSYARVFLVCLDAYGATNGLLPFRLWAAAFGLGGRLPF